MKIKLKNSYKFIAVSKWFVMMILALPLLYLGFIVFAVTFLALNSIAFYQYLLLSSITYEITDQKLTVKKGVFTLKKDYLELYRVIDMQLFSPFFGRILNYCNVTLYSRDLSSPTLRMMGIPNGEAVVELLRDEVEGARENSRVYETV